jgi:hypothetical protein
MVKGYVVDGNHTAEVNRNNHTFATGTRHPIN